MKANTSFKYRDRGLNDNENCPAEWVFFFFFPKYSLQLVQCIQCWKHKYSKPACFDEHIEISILNILCKCTSGCWRWLPYLFTKCTQLVIHQSNVPIDPLLIFNKKSALKCLKPEEYLFFVPGGSEITKMDWGLFNFHGLNALTNNVVWGKGKYTGFPASHFITLLKRCSIDEEQPIYNPLNVFFKLKKKTKHCLDRK